ncbi:MAG: gliding motility-associated C-terminal domain-containing protein, partial [candidate division WOR-3 bacterium]
DLEGVDSSTIRLDVNGVIYTIDSPELAYRNDSLIFTSSRLWENAETVSVTLVSAQDIYGAPLVDTLEYMFVVDLLPPTYSLDAPSRTMIRENQPIIEISIVDSLAGVDDSSIVLTINGEVFRYPRFSVIPLEPFVKKLIFNSMNNNLKFRQGDTVRVTISACDSPNYCPPNCSDFSFVFVIEPAIACLVHPNPFTPNEDGYNDFTVFSYPYMFSETAELYIYNKNNIEVFRATIPPVTDFRDVLGRTWYGLDKNKNRLQEGVYLYIIKVGGEVVCNGTVVIAK